MELRLGVSTLPLKMKKNIIYFLKLVWVISFLWIMMPGENELPLFLGLFLFLYQFIYDVVTLPHSHEIFWEGLLTIFIIGTLIAGFKSKLYKDRYQFILCQISLLCTLGLFFFVGFANAELTPGIFNFAPIVIFFTTSFYLILKHFSPDKP